MDALEIGTRIKQARTLRNLTLDEVATEIGVAKSTIQRYENGLIVKLKLPVLQAIADCLRVNPAWLCGQDAPMVMDDSLKSILEKRVDELGISLEEVAKKADVSLHWLKNIDSFIPSEFGDYEIGYDWITRVAEAIGLSGSILRAALARQEAPVYEGPLLSAEDVFKGAVVDFSEPHSRSATDDHYYLNDETRQIAQEIFDNPDLRSLFDAAKDISPAQLKSQIDYLTFLKRKEKGENDEGC